MNNNNNPVSPLNLPAQSEPNSSIQAQIVSQTPGRIRIRVAPVYRKNHKIASLVSGLKEKLAIYRVRANVCAGSVTIFYGQKHLNSEDIRQILQDIGVIVQKMTVKSPPLNHGYSDAAFEVSRIAGNLNQDVKRATKGALDLRFLFSFSFAVLALRQLIVKGLQLEVIPWYVLAWYAFDSFIKLHGIDELKLLEKEINT